MEIRYVYHYIYLPAAPRAASSGLGPDAAAIRRQLDALVEACKDESTKARMEDIQKLVNRLLGIIAQIPSNGIRKMLMGKIEEIMTMAAKGDLEGAQALGEKTVNLAEQCAELCYHIQNNINALANPTYVQGKAAGLCKAIAAAAADAMDKAGSLGELQEISDLTDRAVEIMRNLKSLDPKSRDYADWCRELVGILGQLAQMAQGEGEMPGMEGDSIAWQHEEAGRVRDRVDQLRGKTTDVFELQNLDRLDDAFAGILEETKGMPAGQKQAVTKEIETLLKQAADGDIQGALREALALKEKLGRTNKLRGFADKRLGHLEKAFEGLHGPAQEAAGRVLAKLVRARDLADSPEAVEKLDKQIEAAQVAVAALKDVPAGGQVRHPAYRQLLALERELGPSDAAEGADGAKKPGLGRDAFGRGTGLVRGRAGTTPLPADPFADLPKGDALGRLGGEIGGLEALAQGIADPQDREAVMGVAARALKAIKGARSGPELAMLAAELQQVTKAAKGLREGNDQAANRYACDRAFQAEGYAGEGSDPAISLDAIVVPTPPAGDAFEPRERPRDPAGLPRVSMRGTDTLRGPIEIPKPPTKAGTSEGLTPPPDPAEDPAIAGTSEGLAPPPDVLTLSNVAR